MKVNRNQIVYIPYPSKQNKINESQATVVRILHRKYKICRELAVPTKFSEMIKTKTVILNWIEDGLDYKMKFQLLLYQLLGAKIVWAFHNKVPHDTECRKNAVKNMKWLADRSNCIWLYSQNSRKYIPNRKHNEKKAVYIPHVMYESRIEEIRIEEIQKKYGIKDMDFVFTIFGLIRPYKNIEDAIESFNRLNLSNSKLVIVGNPVNKEYAQKIKNMCIANPNIILNLRYIPNRELDGIIGISDVILLSYDNESSMNSGVMIQAFSNGKTVISPDICMARDFVKEGFLYCYRKSLETVMKKAYLNGKDINSNMGKQAQSYIREKHNEEIVARELFLMLEK